MPALLSAREKGVFFYFEKAVFEDKSVLLGLFGRPGQSLMRSCQGIPWINQKMLCPTGAGLCLSCTCFSGFEMPQFCSQDLHILHQFFLVSNKCSRAYSLVDFLVI